MEFSRWLSQHITSKKFLALGSIATGIFYLSSCDKGTPLNHEAVPTPARAVTLLIPDMSGFLDPNNLTQCYHSSGSPLGKRPCAPLIRTQPNVKSGTPIINADPSATQPTRVAWPQEGKHAVAVICFRSDGEPDTEYTAAQATSTIYYEVEVPKEHVLNPALQNSASEQIGYISILDFNTIAPDSRLSTCQK